MLCPQAVYYHMICTRRKKDHLSINSEIENLRVIISSILEKDLLQRIIGWITEITF